MDIFQASKRFPREETFSLTDQIRRSSRAVSANISEAWEKYALRGDVRLQANASCRRRS
ncbi:MAG: four helix bundle protein [Fimbriimonadales bacterium]